MNKAKQNPEPFMPSLGTETIQAEITSRFTLEELQSIFAAAQKAAWESLHSFYMTTQEAGAYLKLSPRWLEELRVIGGGPLYLKPGKRVLYRKDLLDEWAEAFERQSTAE
jgi:excisionase family DNA binding protein